MKKIKASRISVSGTVTVDISNSPGDTYTDNYTFNNVRTNKKRATHTIFSKTGLGLNLTADNILGLINGGTPGSDFEINSDGTNSTHFTDYGGETRIWNDKPWLW